MKAYVKDTRAWDAYGRTAGLSLGAAYTVAYNHDAAGRFSGLQSAVCGLQSNTCAYSYLG